MALTKIDDRGLNTPIDLLNNEKIRFGTGNALELFHDGTNSIIDNTTGELRIQTDGAMRLMSTGLAITDETNSDTIVSAQADGAVTLYYDNSPKLETTSTGVKYTGDLRADDDYRIKLGTSQELNIYHHNSGVSVIENTDQVLKLRAKAGEEGILINPDAEVKLHYDGGGTMATTQYGIEIYDELNLYHQSGNSYIKNDTGNLHIGTDGYTAIYGGNDFGETAAKFINDGAVELYYDNSKKFETTSGGAKVTGFLNLTAGLHVPDGSSSGDSSIVIGAGNDFRLFHSSAHSHIRHDGTGHLFIESIDANITLRAGDNAGGTHDSIVCTNNAGVKLYYDTNVKFETTSVGATLTGRLSNYYDSTQVAGLYLRNSNDSGTAVQFVKNDGGLVGSISQTTSATSYNTSSDYRLKENEVAISDGITRLKTLKPYKFNFKIDPDTTVDGFFAHEVTPAVPEAITGEKDGTEMQGIDQSKIVPLLTAALQEAITKIETLETKVAALEAK